MVRTLQGARIYLCIPGAAPEITRLRDECRAAVQDLGARNASVSDADLVVWHNGMRLVRDDAAARGILVVSPDEFLTCASQPGAPWPGSAAPVAAPTRRPQLPCARSSSEPSDSSEASTQSAASSSNSDGDSSSGSSSAPSSSDSAPCTPKAPRDSGVRVPAKKETPAAAGKASSSKKAKEPPVTTPAADAVVANDKKKKRLESLSAPAPKKSTPARRPRVSADADVDAPAQALTQASAPLVAVTGVEDREGLCDVLAGLHARISEDGGFGRQRKPTHLVAGNDVLSAKVLLALAFGIPILRPEWVWAGLAAGALPPPEGYYHACFDAADHQRRLALVEDRDRTMLPTGPQRGPAILRKYVVSTEGARPYPTPAALQELLTATGARVVRSTMPAPSLTTDEKFVVLFVWEAVPAPTRKREHADYMASVAEAQQALAEGHAVVSPEWLYACLVQGKAVDPADYYPELLRDVGTPVAAPAASPLRFTKTAPGPRAAVKSAQHQWSTQQLHDSDASSAGDDS